MCHPVQCPRCGKTGWAGCGQHVDSVMKNVPAAQRCTCREVPDDDPCDLGCQDQAKGQQPAVRRPIIARSRSRPSRSVKSQRAPIPTPATPHWVFPDVAY